MASIWYAQVRIPRRDSFSGCQNKGISLRALKLGPCTMRFDNDVEVTETTTQPGLPHEQHPSPILWTRDLKGDERGFG